MSSRERVVRTESVRIPRVRDSYGSCKALGDSILKEGLHRPITLWRDGTLISGGRRLFAHILIDKPRIQAVFIDTIEDAAKQLLADNQDERASVRMKWSEICRLWEILRRLDEPAAARRAEESRRRGIELRRLTQSGERPPGRARARSEDYVITQLAEAFGVSAGTARCVELIYQTGYGTRIEATDEKRELARELMADVDVTGQIWPNYQRLKGERPPITRPRTVAPAAAAPAARQIVAWEKSLPRLEGLIAGLVELGPPNADLTWDQVGPVHARLAVARRELEKVIKQMKEINKS